MQRNYFLDKKEKPKLWIFWSVSKKKSFFVSRWCFKSRRFYNDMRGRHPMGLAHQNTDWNLYKTKPLTPVFFNSKPPALGLNWKRNVFSNCSSFSIFGKHKHMHRFGKYSCHFDLNVFVVCVKTRIDFSTFIFRYLFKRVGQ